MNGMLDWVCGLGKSVLKEGTMAARLEGIGHSWWCGRNCVLLYLIQLLLMEEGDAGSRGGIGGVGADEHPCPGLADDTRSVMLSVYIDQPSSAKRIGLRLELVRTSTPQAIIMFVSSNMLQFPLTRLLMHNKMFSSARNAHEVAADGGWRCWAEMRARRRWRR